MREILEISSTEGRPMPAEETDKYDRIEADVDMYTSTVDRREQQVRTESSITDIVSEARVSCKALTKREPTGCD